MRCLTLTQPWSTLVSSGYKRIETRSWSSPHRGELAIHAAKHFPEEARLLCLREPFRTTLAALGITSWRQLPTGVVLATCTLTNCKPTEEMAPLLDARERAFGDYTAGRWAWLLAVIRPLPEPIEAKGSLGVWNWEMPR